MLTNSSAVRDFADSASSVNSGASWVHATTQASSFSASWKLATSLRHSSVCIWIGRPSLSALCSALASSAIILLQLQIFSVRSSRAISGLFLGLGFGLRLRSLGRGLLGSLGLGLAFDDAVLPLFLLFFFLFVEQQALRVLEGLQHRGRDRLALRVVLSIRLELLEGLEVGIGEQLLQRRPPQALVDARLEELGVVGGEALERFDRRKLWRRRRRRDRILDRSGRCRCGRGARLGPGLGRLRLRVPRLLFQPRPARQESLVSGHRASRP